MLSRPYLKTYVCSRHFLSLANLRFRLDRCYFDFLRMQETVPPPHPFRSCFTALLNFA